MCGIEGISLCSLFPVAVTTEASVPLWEDKSLAGFMPLKGLPLQPVLTITDNASQMVSPSPCGLVVTTIEHIQVCIVWPLLIYII